MTNPMNHTLMEPHYNDMIDYVRHFHECADQLRGVGFDDTPTVMRSKGLIDEEIQEFNVELNETRFQALIQGKVSVEQKAKLTKELCDAIWVLIDFSITHSLPLEEAFAMVYKSNMSKIDPATQKPYVKDETGKVKKGPHYKPADLTQLFKE